MPDERGKRHALAGLRFVFWLLIGIWTGCVAASLLWNVLQQENHSLELARRTAQITFENDVLYRRWCAQHGGVYVGVSEDTPPNPYLEVPQRDVTTTSGVLLTLVNPAYMVRQAHALAGATGGSRGHLTSLKPIRPENAPDPWEAAALRSLEQGVPEVSSVEETAGGESLRLIRPLVTEQGCLSCHAAQGYKLGDIRGGVSVSVPMASLRAVEKRMAGRLTLAHLGLWLVGLAGIVVFRRTLGREMLARQRANEDLREREENIRASLAEKEVLLKEIHHRVKNNMQVISSLVALQAERSRETPVCEVLEDVTHRVRSMALVHERLYQSADMSRVEFAEYARSLLDYLWRAHGTAAANVHLALDLEPVSLSVNTAVPCGLILNELVSNSLKHAFDGRAGGEVAVWLRGGPEGRVCLRVRDNGTGLPATFDWQQADSLGLRLVQMLAGQLHAAVECSRNEGAEFTITFGGPKTGGDGKP